MLFSASDKHDSGSKVLKALEPLYFNTEIIVDCLEKFAKALKPLYFNKGAIMDYLQMGHEYESTPAYPFPMPEPGVKTTVNVDNQSDEEIRPIAMTILNEYVVIKYEYSDGTIKEFTYAIQ